MSSTSRIGNGHAVADELRELLEEDLGGHLVLEILRSDVVGAQHLQVAVAADEHAVLDKRRILLHLLVDLARAHGQALITGRRQDEPLADQRLEDDLLQLDLLQEVVRKVAAAGVLVIRGLLLQRLLVLGEVDGLAVDPGDDVGRAADQVGNVESHERNDDEPQHPRQVADVAAHGVEHLKAYLRTGMNWQGSGSPPRKATG